MIDVMGHSERSEESRWTIVTLNRSDAPVGFFAALGMTSTGSCFKSKKKKDEVPKDFVLEILN
jgi:hypothetical protein